MNINVNQRQKLLVILAGLALLILVGDRLVFTPMLKSWKERSERITKLKQSVTEGNQLLKREKFIRDRWEGMRTNTLPSDRSLAESQIFKAFDRWSRDSGVSISGLRPQPKQNADDYMTIECRADASGNISSLTKFLYQIEKDPLAVKVDSTEFIARDNNGEQLTLSLQVSGLVLNPPATKP